MHDELRNYWHPVARAADIGDRPYAAELLGQRIVLFRAGDEIVALDDLCIHRGTALSLGWLADGQIVCHYHGWRYNWDGACTRIPSLPAGVRIPPKARVPRYSTGLRYGLVWVCLGTPAAPIPAYAAYDDDTMATVLYDPFRWKANAARIIENALDYTHFPWVHDGLLGTQSDPTYPEVDPQILDDGLRYKFDDHRNDTTRHYRLWLPFTLELTVRTRVPDEQRHLEASSPVGRNYSMLFTCCPISSTESIQWFFTSRDWSLTQPDEHWYAFDATVMAQDQRVVESQRPEELPLDLTAELHLRGTETTGTSSLATARDSVTRLAKPNSSRPEPTNVTALPDPVPSR
ncbi:MAG: Rieske 2Fe-2S domain-containing protein, partial [Acidimicrobiales bacterium]